jgi:hypothetical protein
VLFAREASHLAPGYVLGRTFSLSLIFFFLSLERGLSPPLSSAFLRA